MHSVCIHQFINTPDGLQPVTEERKRLPLPGCPGDEASLLHYGPYLNAISELLSKDSCKALQIALSSHLRRPIGLHELKGVDLISEKHGALYHVAKLRAHLADQTVSLAINVAVRQEQQAFLENEYELLCEFQEKSRLPFLPAPYLREEALYEDGATARLPLKLFFAEWFEQYHEFHLSPVEDEAWPIIRLWENGSPGRELSRGQTLSLYRQAAAILTHYLDPLSFREIYPWHHAAGDFVLKQQGREIDLRLITVRDYRCLLSPGSNFEDMWIAVIHFFLNLSLRLRLDRMDGTGELAWAGPHCLRALVAGFFQAWREKARRHSSLPSESQVLSVLRSFNALEWLPVGEMVLENGMVEEKEVEFLRPRLEDHLTALACVLQEEITDASLRAKSESR